MNELKKELPRWLTVVNDLLDSGLTYSSNIERSDLWNRLGYPNESSLSVLEYRRATMAFHSDVGKIRRYLLEEHQMYIDAVSGIGWQVMDSSRQAPESLRRMYSAINDAIAKAAMVSAHVNLERLTQEQLRETADAQASITNMRVLLERSKQIPSNEFLRLTGAGQAESS
jgi:hypothetical protein